MIATVALVAALVVGALGLSAAVAVLFGRLLRKTPGRCTCATVWLARSHGVPAATGLLRCPVHDERAEGSA